MPRIRGTDQVVVLVRLQMTLLVERFDANGDGKVDFQEYSKWMAPGYFSHR